MLLTVVSFQGSFQESICSVHCTDISIFKRQAVIIWVFLLLVVGFFTISFYYLFNSIVITKWPTRSYNQRMLKVGLKYLNLQKINKSLSIENSPPLVLTSGPIPGDTNIHKEKRLHRLDTFEFVNRSHRHKSMTGQDRTEQNFLPLWWFAPEANFPHSVTTNIIISSFPFVAFCKYLLFILKTKTHKNKYFILRLL